MLEVGLLLLVLPWSAFWERNYFAAVSPLIRLLVSNNFVRGAVSGLGVVNLVMGFAELMAVVAVRQRHDVADGHNPAEAAPYARNPDTQVDR